MKHTHIKKHRRFLDAHQEITLLITGAAFLGSFVMIGMHAPAIYEAARAQMEEIKQTYDDAANQKQYLNGLRETHKNWEREIKNFSRTKGVDLSNAQNLLSQFLTAIGALESAVGSEGFWQMQDANDIQKELGDELQHLYAVQNYYQLAEQIKNAKRSAKDMEGQLKQVKKNLQDVERSELQGYIDGYTHVIGTIEAQYAAIDVSDPDLQYAIQDVQSVLNYDLSEHSQNFYDKFNELNEKATSIVQQTEAKKQVKYAKLTFKKLERNVKRLMRRKKPPVPAELLESIEQLRTILPELEEMAHSTEFDPPAFWEVNNDRVTIESETWEYINNLNMLRDLDRWFKNVQRDLENTARMVADFEKQSKHGGIDQGTIAELKELQGEMETAVANAQEAYPDDPEGANEYRAEYYEWNQDLYEILSELQPMVETSMPEREYPTMQKVQPVPVPVHSSSPEVQAVQGPAPTKEELEQITKILNRAEQRIANALSDGSLSTEQAQQCRGIIADARPIIAHIRAAFEQGGDPAPHMEKLQKLGENMPPHCNAFFSEGEEGASVKPPPPPPVEQQLPPPPPPPPATTSPDTVTIRGRWIDHFTQKPIAGAVVLTWDGQTRRTVTTDSNGVFAITADPMTLPKSFGTWPDCHDGIGFGLMRTSNNSFAVNVNISGHIGDDRLVPATGNEVNLGDVPFMPAVSIALTSDIPVKFSIYTDKEGGSGNSLYKTEHGLTYAIPLMVPVRVTVTDQSGTRTTSPSLTLPQDHGCTPVTLSFSQGEFTWK